MAIYLRIITTDSLLYFDWRAFVIDSWYNAQFSSRRGAEMVQILIHFRQEW